MSAKPKFAHFVFRTGQPDAIREFYLTPLDDHMVHENDNLASLTFDKEHNHVALLTDFGSSG
ncbi:hypothetical protein [Streptomyces shenzhenensis]|uniref:hypothetical protein n=1 Tax=Streptomyces shenzhenensis TaxID=943815 RepID=UPI0033F91902